MNTPRNLVSPLLSAYHLRFYQSAIPIVRSRSWKKTIDGVALLDAMIAEGGEHVPKLAE